jgi:hypothetical protein
MARYLPEIADAVAARSKAALGDPPDGICQAFNLDKNTDDKEKGKA